LLQFRFCESFLSEMYKSLHITYVLYFQFNQIFILFASEPELEKLIGISESAHWPLQAGYHGLAVKNLNQYVSLFSHCLVNLQNYQGIEIIGIKSPVYITRFDVAYLENCYYLFIPDKTRFYDRRVR